MSTDTLNPPALSDIRSDGYFTRSLADADPAVFGGIAQELKREQTQIELIASENIVSKAVLEAQGSVFTNKYAEGYPGKRYYQGCAPSDVVEQLAIDRAKELFGCNFVNVQPHSGAQANGGVMLALVKPGETIMGLSLDAGGHLTHGSKPSMSGKWFNAVQYGVREDTHLIDYDDVERQAIECQPKLIIAGGSAYPRQIDFARFRAIADKVGALFMVDMAHFAGLVAGGAHPSPFPHAHVVTTTTHKSLRGPRGGMIMCKAQYAEAIDKAEDDRRRSAPPSRPGARYDDGYDYGYADDAVTSSNEYEGRWTGTWTTDDGRTVSGTYDGRFEGDVRGAGVDYPPPPYDGGAHWGGAPMANTESISIIKD